jgi:hypothetical protein
MREATLVEVRDYFGMNSTEISKEWKVLNEEEKLFFKRGVAAVLDA